MKAGSDAHPLICGPFKCALRFSTHKQDASLCVRRRRKGPFNRVYSKYTVHFGDEQKPVCLIAAGKREKEDGSSLSRRLHVWRNSVRRKLKTAPDVIYEPFGFQLLSLIGAFCCFTTALEKIHKRPS